MQKDDDLKNLEQLIKTCTREIFYPSFVWIIVDAGCATEAQSRIAIAGKHFSTKYFLKIKCVFYFVRSITETLDYQKFFGYT